MIFVRISAKKLSRLRRNSRSTVGLLESAWLVEMHSTPFELVFE
jgi:hypothetical protein